MKKNIIKIIGILFLLFLAWRIFQLVSKSDGERTAQFSRPPVAVEVDSIVHAPIKEIRQFTGTVYPLYRYIVAPKVPGRIIKLNKRIGDRVREGEILASIDDAEYQQDVREAEANLKIALASLAETGSQLQLAKIELERIRPLLEKGIASPSEIDAAQTGYDALQSKLKLSMAQVEQRESLLKSARIRLDYTVLTAPHSGFVGERFVDEGSLLASNAPVLSVVGLDTVIVRTTIPERDYGRISAGLPAEIEVDAFPSQRFHGTVSRIAPVLEEDARVAPMEIEIENGDATLKPGMFARVSVVLEEKEHAQLVPGRAIATRNGEKGVFIVKNNETVARYIPVRIGIANRELTEIVSPELEGSVVTLGHHLLQHGSAVILPTERKRDDVR
jgi:RND family efflux transporter MFP subunit